MARLSWNAVGERYYEGGVDRGVLYVDDSGHAWNGLVSIEETPSGGEARPYFIDGIKYMNLASTEQFEATIGAFYSPEEFDACEGISALQPGLMATQQRRKPFGLSYRTKIGNDSSGLDHGYKLHIVYNALVSPVQRTYNSVSDNPEAPLLRWAITTKPKKIPGAYYSAHLFIDSTRATEVALKAIEDMLYGTANLPPTLPSPADILQLFLPVTTFSITDLGNGLFSVVGSDTEIFQVGDGTFTVNSSHVTLPNADTGQIS